MDLYESPSANKHDALKFTHFPTRQQAVVWRNWNLVPSEKIAKVLKTDREQICALATGMGLEPEDSDFELWHERGYLTIIRRNWHLLPVEQILELLGWSDKKLAFILKEDDFFWIKLGQQKPVATPVHYAPLSEAQLDATAHLRKLIEQHFPAKKEEYRREKPFAFLDNFTGSGEPPTSLPQHSVAQDNSSSGLRLAYSYFAVYGDPLLHEELDPYPDGLLEAYAACGVNAVWLQGVLYSLVPWFGESDYCKDWQIRIRNLRRLAQRTVAHGIGLYLYLNEPRNMPEDFFDNRPNWRGAESADRGSFAMCTSNPKVLNALQNGAARLFEEVPELAGVLTITMSENLTHCRSRSELVSPCPRCADRDPASFPAEVNRAIAAGVHSVNPKADVIAWSWGWNPEWDERTVKLLPKDIKLMCVSETAVETDACGIKGEVLDYSMSKVGPGPVALRLWNKAKEYGLSTVAKVQLNSTWECCAVPYIPVPDLVEEHLNRLQDQGISDFMLTWTLGGWPGGNFELTGKSRNQIAHEKFGSETAPAVLEAWSEFSKAFAEFPLHSADQLYLAPQNFGPANLLFAKKTGYAATMIGFPYDNLDSWRGKHFPEDILCKQFRKLSVGWEKGLQLLSKAADKIQADKKDNLDDLRIIAEATFCHFRSTYLQIRFVMLRNKGNPDSESIIKILQEEISLAKRLATLMQQDSRIGFEASNHYLYTTADLKEKVLNCEYLATAKSLNK